jgi:hypothetical protein
MNKNRGPESEERIGAAAPAVPVRFKRGELNAFLNGCADPPTPDDRTILVGAGSRPATEDELHALAEQLWADSGTERQPG